MAQREGQGLQIAVIIFAMLTIVLAITTYIFYAQSQSAYQERDKKAAELAEERNTNGKMFYRVQALKFVLGMGNVTKQDIEVAKTRAANVADPEVDEIMANFDADMAQVGDQVAGDQARNYRRLAVIHQGVIDKRNASLATANDSVRKAEQTVAATVAAEMQRTKTAEDAAANAGNVLKTEQDNFVSFRQQMDAEKAKLAGQTAAVITKAKADIDREMKEKDAFQNMAKTQQQTIGTIKDRLKELEKGQQDLFENPDGHITLVNQQQQMVWINVGRADGLLKQTTFSVYDHDETRVASDKVKARIEVISLGDHLSVARILEDKPSNPIIKGDIIHTPAWSPGQRIHFAMAGRMDINRDHIDDYEKVKSIIELNGGIIDAELRPNGQRSGPGLSIQTRYLVLGDMPTDTATKDYLAQYTAIQNEIKRYGTEILPVKSLLALMGWKAEERTVELAGGGGDFRKRGPGKTQPPAAGAAPASAPATATPAAAGGATDPFGAGAAPPTAAPPVADPFGGPAAAPKPAGGDADPFK